MPRLRVVLEFKQQKFLGVVGFAAEAEIMLFAWPEDGSRSALEFVQSKAANQKDGH